MTTPVFVGSALGDASFSTTVSAAITGGAAANRAILAFVFNDRGGATTISSCDCGGNTMTALGAGFTHFSGYDGRLFGIAGDSNIATGSNTVTGTMSDINSKPKIIVCAYSSVDGASPFSGWTDALNSTNTATWTVSSAAGDLVVALASAGTLSGNITPGTGTTVDSQVAQNGTGGFYSFALSEPGASSVTIDGTFGGAREWWGTAVSLKGATGGGPDNLMAQSCL